MADGAASTKKKRVSADSKGEQVEEMKSQSKHMVQNSMNYNSGALRPGTPNAARNALNERRLCKLSRA